MNKPLFLSIAAAFSAALATSPAQAEPVAGARGGEFLATQGGFAARSGAAVQSNHGSAAGRRAVAGDAQGNLASHSTGSFALDNGVQGSRARTFNRSADGSVNANGSASANGANGSASRGGSYTRSAEGSASGARTTSATNANTGNTFDATTTYTKGEGASRTVSCTDAAGNTVTCGSR